MKRKTFLLLSILIVLFTTVIVYSADAAGIPKKAISTVATFLKSDLPATTVYNDQSNTFGAFTQIFTGTVDFQGTNTFGSSKIIIRNPTATFASTIAGGTQTQNSTFTLPITDATSGTSDTLMSNNVFATTGRKNMIDTSTNFRSNADVTKLLNVLLSGASGSTILTIRDNQTTSQGINIPNISNTDTFATLGTAQTITGNHQFTTSSLILENPAKTFASTLAGGAVTANRTLNLPLITGTDTLGALNVASKWTANQTLQTPQINGFDINYTTYAADHTAVNTEDVIVMDASAASRALTLPTAVGNTGKEFTVVNGVLTAGNMVRILTTSSQTIDGYFSATGSLNLTNADTRVTLQSNGANWNSIDSEEATPFDYYIKGSTTRWYGGATDPAASSTLLSVVSTLRATPWVVPHTITIDKIQTEISTAANPTTTTCNIGIYRDNGNVYPQALVSGSDVGTFTTTAAVHTLTFGSPITLTKGLYWLAWTCGTAATTQPTFRATPVGAIPPVLGYVSTMGANGAGTAYTVGFVYGALPSQYPAGATILANTNTPMILMEITKG